MVPSLSMDRWGQASLRIGTTPLFSSLAIVHSFAPYGSVLPAVSYSRSFSDARVISGAPPTRSITHSDCSFPLYTRRQNHVAATRMQKVDENAYCCNAAVKVMLCLCLLVSLYCDCLSVCLRPPQVTKDIGQDMGANVKKMEM